MPCALLLASACADDKDDHGATLKGTSAQERYASLERAKGCKTSTSLPEFSPACEELLVDWVDCVAQDLDQCLCESDGELNCEGSFKANEGPALCILEMDAFESAGCDPD